ncbi:hypothetical protein J2Z22_000666 [Paenibacillus forsythiae]|uniref:Uncharacterized protein n=1 Tax=Paenibacillus forsythiae TaxID=365616 RepID=A0ABU3H2V3_9BACL|nr:hypothetical protein [Paenibacillus forsythiae]MDT3425153.1 hypothetical protein [Paenibacillus forsythiae]
MTIVVQGQQWKITDPTRSAVFDIKKAGNVLNVNNALTDVEVDVRAGGSI